MARKMLSDRQWARLAPALLGDPKKGGRPPLQANRNTVEGILWIARTGAPWRDLPPEFGKWNTVYQRFRRWTKAGVFEQLNNCLAGELQLDTVMVDGTFVKVHQHGAGAPKRDAPGTVLFHFAGGGLYLIPPSVKSLMPPPGE